MSLWRDRDFLKYWSATVLGGFGNQVTFLAMPLVAVISLHATATQTGVLRATVSLPNLVFGLLIGVWVDRVRRHPLLIASALGYAAILATVPLAALFHVLTLVQVYAVSFAAGSAGLVGWMAATAYVPTLIGRERLVEANSRVATTGSTIQIVGPSAAGVLVQLVTAPIAVVADAVLEVGAALIYVTIRRPEPPPARGRRRRLREEVAEGLRAVARHRFLRLIVLIVGSFNFFSGLAQAVFVLFMVRELRLPPATIGLVFAVTGPGALIGALLAPRLARRVGMGWTIMLGGLLFGTGWAVTPLASGSRPVATLILMAGQLALFTGSMVANINLGSLRQAITPDRLQGRVQASMLLVVQGVVPPAALLGGVLGQSFGLRPALGVAAIGSLLAMAFLATSPLRRLRTVADAGAVGQSAGVEQA